MVKKMEAGVALETNEVTIISKSKINRSNQSCVLPPLQAPVRLGPFDQLSPPFLPIHLLYVYETPADSKTRFDELVPTDRLQKAATRLLDYYQHLTGRLRFEESDGTPYIDRLDSGIDYLTARCNTKLDDLKDATTGRIDMTKLPDCGKALVPSFTATLDAVCNDPVFAIQHTRFACGSVSLGIRIHHIVCDADGLFQLVRDLAELYRGIRILEPDGIDKAGFNTVRLSQPPHIRSYLAELCDMRLDDRENALNFEPTLFTMSPSHGSEAATNDATTKHISSAGAPQPKVVGRVTRFSAEELKILKKLAADPAGLGRVSTFDALSAHIFQRVYHARMRLQNHLRSSKNSCSDPLDLPRGFMTSVNLRRPDRLDLPPRYFPNAIINVSTALSHETIVDGSLSQVAKALHTLTHSVDPREVDQTLHWIAAQPDKRCIQPAIVDGLGNLFVTHWSGFAMYAGADLDVDSEGSPIPPALVGPPMTEISLSDGLTFFLATEEQLLGGAVANGKGIEQLRGSSAIDVSLRLSEPVWDFLDLSVPRTRST